MSRYDAASLNVEAAMRRRQFIGFVGGAVAWPLAVRAQQQQIRRVGYLISGPPDTLDVFRRRMAELGYVEGVNLVVDVRAAAGRYERLPDPFRPKIAELAAVNQIPAIYQYGVFVESAGGLMSYGPDIQALIAYAAVFVDKILKGAKPAELPVEQPTKFEFVLNLKAAKALGLTIPESVVLLADKVVE
jgi:hypothetical protein